jgi:D-alanyl-D-alanine carboxypeptidase
MMNRQAQAWGLKNTQFKNVTGLTEPGHYSSARDLAVIAARIINDFPEFYPLLRAAQLQLQQHQAGQPQHAAGPRPGTSTA